MTNIAESSFRHTHPMDVRTDLDLKPSNATLLSDAVTSGLV